MMNAVLTTVRMAASKPTATTTAAAKLPSSSVQRSASGASLACLPRRLGIGCSPRCNREPGSQRRSAGAGKARRAVLPRLLRAHERRALAGSRRSASAGCAGVAHERGRQERHVALGADPVGAVVRPAQQQPARALRARACGIDHHTAAQFHASRVPQRGVPRETRRALEPELRASSKRRETRGSQWKRRRNRGAPQPGGRPRPRRISTTLGASTTAAAASPLRTRCSVERGTRALGFAAMGTHISVAPRLAPTAARR